MGWDPDGPGATAAETASLHEELERLRAAIVRIDAINDNPACFSEEINDLCGRILRPHLYQQDTNK